jgi:hypothetical protein
MTLPRATVKQVVKEEARKSRERWITSAGWQNRGKITWEQWNRPKQELDGAKLEELATVSILRNNCTFGSLLVS